MTELLGASSGERTELSGDYSGVHLGRSPEQHLQRITINQTPASLAII